MKKSLALIISAAMMLTFASCASKTEQTAETNEPAETAVETELDVDIANPWSSADSAEAAGSGAGVGEFNLPEASYESTAGMVNWSSYSYMENMAEADGSIGAADLTVRKALASAFVEEDISGNWTQFGYTWNTTVDGIDVSCRGNVEGQAMVATWSSGDYSYSIMVCGQGDLYDTYGISDEAVSELVSSIN